MERQLARELCALGFEITLLTRDTQPLSGEPFTHVTYQRPSSKDWKSWLLAGRIASVLREIDRARPIALLHAFMLGPPAYYAARSGKPYLITHHDMRIDLGSGRIRRALSGARHAIALNAAQAELFRPLVPVTVIPNGVGGSIAGAAVPDLPPGFLLFAGRFEAAKGVFLLLDAYERVPAASRPTLVLAGDGSAALEVRTRASRLGAIVLPWLAHDVLLATLARASALVMPSSSEASPLLLLEAYRLGVPAIVHDLPMIAADLRDASGAPLARLVPVGDVEAWSLALLSTADPSSTARASVAARARTWPAVAARYATIYRSLA